MARIFVFYLFLMTAVPFTSCVNGEVRVTASCPGTYDGKKHEITSPNYPSRYSNSEDCNWLLEAPEPQRIELKVNSLALERHGRCSYDYLIAYDGINSNVGSIGGKRCSGNSGSSTLVSSSNTMYLRFKSDSSNTYSGFSISYKAMETSNGISLSGSCPNTYDIQASEITSPNYPSGYGNHEDCNWNLEAPRGKRIELKIIDVSMEPSLKCRIDSLEVFNGNREDQDNSIRRVCGNDSGVIMSTSNQVYLRFRTDDRDTDRGFKISFEMAEE